MQCKYCHAIFSKQANLKYEELWGHTHNTSFSLLFTNGPNELKYFSLANLSSLV
jgi:hypothetical protein